MRLLVVAQQESWGLNRYKVVVHSTAGYNLLWIFETPSEKKKQEAPRAPTKSKYSNVCKQILFI